MTLKTLWFLTSGLRSYKRAHFVVLSDPVCGTLSGSRRKQAQLARGHSFPGRSVSHIARSAGAPCAHAAVLVHGDGSIPVYGAGRREGACGVEGPRGLSRWAWSLGRALGIWARSWRRSRIPTGENRERRAQDEGKRDQHSAE